MIFKITITPASYVLILREPIKEGFGINPKLAAAKTFDEDLRKFIKDEFKLKELPKPDMNFYTYLSEDIKEIFTVDSKGNTRWEYEVTLEIQKQAPDKIEK